jgi:hypothetical protein
MPKGPKGQRLLPLRTALAPVQVSEGCERLLSERMRSLGC